MPSLWGWDVSQEAPRMMQPPARLLLRIDLLQGWPVAGGISSGGSLAGNPPHGPPELRLPALWFSPDGPVQMRCAGTAPSIAYRGFKGCSLGVTERRRYTCSAAAAWFDRESPTDDGGWASMMLSRRGALSSASSMVSPPNRASGRRRSRGDARADTRRCIDAWGP